METVIAIGIVALLVIAGVVVHHKYSLRCRLTTKQHEAAGEEGQALRQIQRDIDRGRSASQGFIPF